MRRIPVHRASAAPSSSAADDANLSAHGKVVETAPTLPGTLYIIATPIGNPDDISLRALKTLRSAACIAVESLSVSRSLMAHWNIETPLLSYVGKARSLNCAHALALLQTGHDVALICDAGTPGIADPSWFLARAALHKNLPVIALPGPAAALVALTASGLPAARFVFDGFPPRQPVARFRFFQKLAGEERTIVLYEHPSHLRATLTALEQALGFDRQAAVAWNLTQPAETWLRGTFAEILAELGTQPRRGEITIVIAGQSASTIH